MSSYRNGFKIGLSIGLLLTLLATGVIETTADPMTYRNLAALFLACTFLPVQIATLYQGLWKSKGLFGPRWDGFLNGMSCIEGIVLLILYGFRF